MTDAGGHPNVRKLPIYGISTQYLITSNKKSSKYKHHSVTQPTSSATNNRVMNPFNACPIMPSFTLVGWLVKYIVQGQEKTINKRINFN